MPFDLSITQILIVLVIALLVFGPKRLPEMARGLGKGIQEFKSAITHDGPTSAPKPSPELPRGVNDVTDSVADHDVVASEATPGPVAADDIVRRGSDQPPTPAG